MTDERMRTERVEEWTDDFVIPLGEFIATVQKILEAVPEEFRNEVNIEFDTTGSDYDYSKGELSICYERPWTVEEIAEEKKWELKQILDGEACERRELTRLLKKYGKRQ